MDVTSMLLIRGVAGLVAGMLAMFWPGLTFVFLVMLFGAYAFIDGVANVVIGARRTARRERSWAVILQGLAGIVIGVITFLSPGITGLALVFWVGAWAIITGAFEIAAAIRLRRTITREWLLVLSGALSILLGIVLFAFPAIGAFGLAFALGAYAAASGIMLAALAIRLRTQPALAA